MNQRFPFASVLVPLAILATCGCQASSSPGKPSEALACLDLAALPACSSAGWCWADPLPQGLTITSVHGLASNDAWVAATSILHWDGTNLALVYADPATRFESVFETASGEVWAAGESVVESSGAAAGAIVRLRNGVPQTMRSTPATLISGTGPDDLWFANGETASHWDGNAFTDFTLPGTAGEGVMPLSLSAAGGSAWLTARLASQAPGFLDTLFTFANGAWTGGTIQADAVHAFDASHIWISAGDEVGPLGSPLITGDDVLDEFSAIAGSSPTDVWVIGSESAGGAPALLHSNGTSLERDVYQGTGIPSALFVGSSGWGFIGDSRGELLKLSGGSFVPAIAAPMPYVNLPSLWGTGPDDVYLVGVAVATDLSAPAAGIAEHWDGCRWSVLDFGLGPLGPLGGVWATGSDVWITGQDPGVASPPVQGFLLHKGASGAWTRLSTPDGGVYGSVWGTAANDVWFGGPTFMHWDGTVLSTVPTPTGLPPSPSLTSLTGSASDDIWAVQRETPDTLYHYDGNSWTQQTSPVEGGFELVLSVAKNDVWGWGFGGLERYDGTTWAAVTTPTDPDVLAMWANSPSDVWFGQSLHWNGSVVETMIALGEPTAMWGDGTHVWSLTSAGALGGGGGIQVH